MKLGFITLGCDKNTVDSERYLAQLADRLLAPRLSGFVATLDSTPSPAVVRGLHPTEFEAGGLSFAAFALLLGDSPHNRSHPSVLWHWLTAGSYTFDLGILVDHLVAGTKETRAAQQVAGPHVLVTGHPYVDVWEAVKPATVGIRAWPQVPRGTDWKTGVCAALRWGEPADGARRVLKLVVRAIPRYARCAGYSTALTMS